MGYNLNQLRKLMASNPDEFVKAISGDDIEYWDLTFAAEDAGDLPIDLCYDPLLKLVGHHYIVVREGAIYGMARHLDDSRVREVLGMVAEHDPEPLIRRIAKGVLGDE